MSFEGEVLIDPATYQRARAELGTAFARMVGYLREDGPASVAAVEEALRADNAAAMVLPAHTLKGEAAQFGALPLAQLAERIEDYARTCVERRDSPRDAIADVLALRPMFDRTMALLHRETQPAPTRVPVRGFGRRA